MDSRSFILISPCTTDSNSESHQSAVKNKSESSNSSSLSFVILEKFPTFPKHFLRNTLSRALAFLNAASHNNKEAHLAFILLSLRLLSSSGMMENEKDPIKIRTLALEFIEKHVQTDLKLPCLYLINYTTQLFYLEKNEVFPSSIHPIDFGLKTENEIANTLFTYFSLLETYITQFNKIGNDFCFHNMIEKIYLDINQLADHLSMKNKIKENELLLDEALNELEISLEQNQRLNEENNFLAENNLLLLQATKDLISHIKATKISHLKNELKITRLVQETQELKKQNEEAQKKLLDDNLVFTNQAALLAEENKLLKKKIENLQSLIHYALPELPEEYSTLTFMMEVNKIKKIKSKPSVFRSEKEKKIPILKNLPSEQDLIKKINQQICQFNQYEFGWFSTYLIGKKYVPKGIKIIYNILQQNIGSQEKLNKIKKEASQRSASNCFSFFSTRKASTYRIYDAIANLNNQNYQELDFNKLRRNNH